MHYELKASYTSRLRPHTLGAEGLMHQELKASYTSSLRPHTSAACNSARVAFTLALVQRLLRFSLVTHLVTHLRGLQQCRGGFYTCTFRRPDAVSAAPPAGSGVLCGGLVSALSHALN